MTCAVCQERSSKAGGLCTHCARSYDRDLREAKGGLSGTVWGAIHWAAKRARYFECKRGARAIRSLGAY